MTTPEAAHLHNLQALPEPPPIPQLPDAGPRREPTLRAFAAKVVHRLGPAPALMLAALIDEAVADVQETGDEP